MGGALCELGAVPLPVVADGWGQLRHAVLQEVLAIIIYEDAALIQLRREWILVWIL